MGRHLRDRDVQRIVEILDGWKSGLSWEALIQTCHKRLGLQPVRQTLYRSVRIREAYELAKGRMRSNALSVPLPSSLRAAGERIVRLEAENARLRCENEGLLGQFVIWQYNAHLKGMSEAELNCPLPEVDLGLTQKRKKPHKGI